MRTKFAKIALVVSLGLSVLIAVSCFEASNLDTQGLTFGTEFTPTTLGLNPGRYTSEMNFNWYSGNGAGTNKSFVRLLKDDYHIKDFKGTYGTAGTGNRQHKVTITGLEPDVKYTYRVSNDSTNWSDSYTFKTAPIGSFKFAAVSDIQPSCSDACPTDEGSEIYIWNKTVTKIANAGVTLIVNAGDHVMNGRESEYEGYFYPSQLRSIPTAPVMGNHDTYTENFNYHFNLPNIVKGTAPYTGQANYYFLYNRVLFIGLNTSEESNSDVDTDHNASKFITDFKNTFVAARKAHSPIQYDFIVVTHHRSTNSVQDGGHALEATTLAYQDAGLQRIMTENGVDLVITGHDHIYVRSKLMYNDTVSTNGAGTYYLTIKPGSGTDGRGRDIGFAKTTADYYKDNYPWLTREIDEKYFPISYGKHLAYNKDDPGYAIFEVSGTGYNAKMVVKVYEYPYTNTNPSDTFTITPTLSKKEPNL